jgi:2-dehydro-3-deoxyphosphooctonate aldolase (KDO 8-P synthase)
MFVICGVNVIESTPHTAMIAAELQQIFKQFDVRFIFKASVDKANRSSSSSYRGPGFVSGLDTLRTVKKTLGVELCTDIHEPSQAKLAAEVVDVIQIPAFLCRQTDLLVAAAKTGKTIHLKKGQMVSSAQMHKAKEKLLSAGSGDVILCERGTFFGYQDQVVDFRNLHWLRSATNTVSFDITHSMQIPAQIRADGTVSADGHRELIPMMGKLAMASGVDGLFIETHDNPRLAKCDAATQWPLHRMHWLLSEIGLPMKKDRQKRQKPQNE